MGRVVEGVVLLVVLVALVNAAVLLWRRRQLTANAQWEVRKHTRAGRLVVCLEKPDEDRWIIGEVRADEVDRGARIAELEAEAREAAVEANSK